MTTPAEVLANLELLAADAQRRAAGNLALANAMLNLGAQAAQWSPGDDAVIDFSVEGGAARLTDGMNALGEMRRYRQALANLRAPAAPAAPLPAQGDATTALPLEPTDRSGKLDALAEALATTAANAAGNLQALVDIMKCGGEGAPAAIAEQMQAFVTRAHELQTIFETAGEVAGCAASA